MGKSSLTHFGKTVKKKLVDVDRNQKWLIQEVVNRTGLYFDGFYLYNILTGAKNTPKIVQAIKEILDISDA